MPKVTWDVEGGCCCREPTNEMLAVQHLTTHIGPHPITGLPTTHSDLRVSMLDGNSGQLIWTSEVIGTTDQSIVGNVTMPSVRSGLGINSWGETLTCKGAFFSRYGAYTRRLNPFLAQHPGTPTVGFGIHGDSRGICDLCFDIHNRVYWRLNWHATGTDFQYADRHVSSGSTHDRHWIYNNSTQVNAFWDMPGGGSVTEPQSLCLVNPQIPDEGIYFTGKHVRPNPASGVLWINEWLWKFRNTDSDKTQEWVEDDQASGGVGTFLNQACYWVRATKTNGDAIACIANEGYSATSGGRVSDKGAVVIYSSGGGVINTIEVFDAPFVVVSDGHPTRVELADGGNFYVVAGPRIYKLDSSGTIIWFGALGQTSTNSIPCMAADTNTGDLFISRSTLSPNVKRLRSSDGSTVWETDIPGTAEALAYRDFTGL